VDAELDISRRTDPRASRFLGFDSLRAIAALSVVAYHSGFAAGLPVTDSPLGQYTSQLQVGVSIFFLISGFLLYRPFAGARLRGERFPHVRAYAWRRFLRIVPAYWVALTVITIWLGLPGVFTETGIPLYYGFAQVYDGARAGGGIAQAWTLCVEVTFYAFLPLWALAMRRLQEGADPRRLLAGELAALAALFVFSQAYKVWATLEVHPTTLDSAPYFQTLPNFLDQFALGMALAVLSVWYERRDLPRPLQVVARHPWLPWLAALVAFWVVSTQIGFTGLLTQKFSVRMFLGRHELYTLVALGLLLPAVFSEPGRGLAGRVLANRALSFVGVVSYALYLYHVAVLNQLDDWLGDALTDVLPGGVGWRFGAYLVLGTIGGVAVATLSWYLIERPALSLKRLAGPVTERDRGEVAVEPAP
jgi:peptidoglycan/LPS O-acetylase OafA/YrhL